MIQSQPIAGPPPDSGGGNKDGHGEYARRPSAGPPPHRSGGSEHRVHRHDSRDSGASGGAKDWRRPSRSHEVYRRDDRGFKERWKERKRWEKPRMREPVRDFHRDMNRDYTKDYMNDHPRSEFYRGHEDHPRNMTRESHRDTHEHIRSRISYEGAKREDKKRPSFDRPDIGREISPTNTKAGSRGPLYSSSGDSVKPPKKFLRRPGDKFRDLIMGAEKTVKPSSPKTAEPDTRSTLDNYTLSGATSRSLDVTPSMKKKPRDEDRVNTGDLKKEVPETASPLTGPSSKSIDNEHKSEKIEREGRRMDGKQPKSATEVIGATNVESLPVSAEKSESDATKTVPDEPDFAGVPAKASEKEEEQRPEILEETEKPHSAEYLPDLFKHEKTDRNGDTDQTIEDANGTAVSETKEVPIPLRSSEQQPTEDHSDDTIGGTIDPSHGSDTVGLLPQEVVFCNKLMENFKKIRGKVSPGAYVSRSWSVPEPNELVVLTVSKYTNKIKADIATRERHFQNSRKKWLRSIERLDIEAAGGDQGAIAESSPAVVSKSQQVSLGTQSRKRSREEDFSQTNANRRNRDRHSRAHGDVARSEAEFLEILANLEAQTARDPLVRARLTSAHIPDQLQSPQPGKFQSTNALVIDHSTLLRRLETDAVDDFTQEEHGKFIEAYVQWPKEFGKIATVVGRSFNDCVMHYYRTKKQADYKRILLQRNKKKRGRKPRKRADDDSIPSTPAHIGVTPGVDDNSISSTAISSISQSSESLAKTNDEMVKPLTITDVNQAEVVTEEGERRATSNGVQPVAVKITGSSNENQTEQKADAIVPPPVLPVHQMDTLATAALLGDQGWTSVETSAFEHLLGIYGSCFQKIASHLGKSVDTVRAFYERHRQRYEGLIQRVDSIDVMEYIPPSVMGTNVFSMNTANGAGVFTGPPTGVFMPIADARNVSEAHVGGSAKGINQGGVPPPVLPLDAEQNLVNSAADDNQETSRETSSTNAIVAPSTPQGWKDPSTKHIHSSELPIWHDLEMNATIPPLLPRPGFAHCEGEFKGYSLHVVEQFEESHERS